MTARKKSFLSFLAELLIVFIGVYGAFELNRYQQNGREQKIEKSYFESFYSELVKLTSDISATQKIIDTQIQSITSAQAKGEQPALKPINLQFYASMLITKAGFNDDVFMQLSPELAASLSGGYDNVMVAIREVDEFNSNCNRLLLADEPIRFYNSKGQLKPEFDWYISGLKRLQARFNILSRMMNEGAVPATKSILEDLN